MHPPLRTDKAGRETALLGATGSPVVVSADWTESGKYAHGAATVQMKGPESVHLFADPEASVAGTVECKVCSGTLALPHSITLRRLDVRVADSQELKISADGSIAAANIPAGQYSLEITRPRKGLYIASLEVGGKTVDDRVLRLSEKQSAVIQMSLGPTSSSVSGVIKKGAFTESSGIILESLDSKTVRILGTGSGDEFSIGNVAPGRYRVSAWADRFAAPYKHPDLLAKATMTIVDVGDFSSLVHIELEQNALTHSWIQ